MLSFRILILDSHQSAGEALVEACCKLGYPASIRTDYSGVLQALETQEVQLLFVALEMPEISGPKVMAGLRKRAIHTPIVLTKGNCTNPRLLTAGKKADGYLSSSWDLKELEILISGFDDKSDSNKRMLAAEAEIAAMNFSSDITLAQGTSQLVDGNFFEDPLGGSSANSSSSCTSREFESEPVTTPQVFAQLEEDEGQELKITLEPLSIEPASKLPPLTLTKSSDIDLSGKAEVENSTFDISLQSEKNCSLRGLPRVSIVCHKWELVRCLCSDVMQGLRTITVRASIKLEQGESVILALTLPDEMIVSIQSTILNYRSNKDDTKRTYQLNLVGFGGDEIAYLLGRSDKTGQLDNVNEGAESSVRSVGTQNSMPPKANQSAAIQQEPQEQEHPIIPEARDSLDSNDRVLKSTDGNPKISWG